MKRIYWTLIVLLLFGCKTPKPIVTSDINVTREITEELRIEERKVAEPDSALIRALAQCDLLIIVGARVNDRAILMPSSKLEQNRLIIHIDIDTAEIGKNIGPTIPLVGDARLVFENLLFLAYLL